MFVITQFDFLRDIIKRGEFQQNWVDFSVEVFSDPATLILRRLQNFMTTKLNFLEGKITECIRDLD